MGVYEPFYFLKIKLKFYEIYQEISTLVERHVNISYVENLLDANK